MELSPAVRVESSAKSANTLGPANEFAGVSSGVSEPPGGWPLPRAAYIHVPFCRHRCGYCNFSVVADRDDLIERFLAAIDLELAALNCPAIDTVFIGGGTPTHLAPDQLARLLQVVTSRLQLAAAAEWSVEANPEDITPERLDVLTAAGVNRISLGVQSFAANKLSVLERGHDRTSAIRAIQRCQSAIGNVSLDLIFAAPNESLADWHNDLTTALSLPISHLSTYALTFEKGTAFWNRRRQGELQPATEPTELAMYQASREVTARAGLEHYEISNFALPGKQCRHNLAYWQGHGWYAAGPGAARFVAGRREVNHRSTSRYLQRVEAGEDPTAESESIDATQAARERAAFGVRLLDGVDLREIGRETGVSVLRECAAALAHCASSGLILIDDGQVRLTEQGILFADTVAAELLS